MQIYSTSGPCEGPGQNANGAKNMQNNLNSVFAKDPEPGEMTHYYLQNTRSMGSQQYGTIHNVFMVF